MDKMMWTEPANPPTKPTPKPVVVSRLFVVLMISTVGTAAAVWVEQEAPQFGTFGAVKDVPGRYTLFPTPNYNRAEIAAYLEAGGLALEQPAGMTPPSIEQRIAAVVTAERLRCAAIAAEQYDHVSADWSGADEGAKVARWIEQAILAGGDVGTYDGSLQPERAGEQG
jgi:hypothetical protein